MVVANNPENHPAIAAKITVRRLLKQGINVHVEIMRIPVFIIVFVILPGQLFATVAVPDQVVAAAVTVPLVPAINPYKDSTAGPAPLIPPFSVLEANGAMVGNITIIIKDVFDTNKPRESGLFYRTVNQLHHNTRASTVAELLLFKTGDRFSARSLAESERLLRDEQFLIDARIRPVQYKDNRVDIEVITTDVWTLGISYSFKTEGGTARRSFELRESNFLGFGKEIRLKKAENIDRTELTFRYFDPFLAGNRSELTVEYSDNSDGLVKKLNLSRPFYSLDSRWSYDANYEFAESVDKIYQNGEVVQRFGHNKEYYEFSLGLSEGLVDNKSKRWTFGYNVHRDTFSPNDLTTINTALPNDRILIYPYLGFGSVENKYIKIRRLNFINRTEDHNMGKEFSLKLGWSDKSLKSGINSLIFDGQFSKSYIPKKNHMYVSNIDVSGRYTEGSTDNLTIEGLTRYYYPLFENQIFHYMLNMEYGHNLDGDNQIFLGGGSGLRGYPLRLQQGNRKILFTMEHRYYTDWHIFQLVRVGGALFFDIGRAWSSDTPDSPNNRVLKDVGLGLRFSSSRSDKGKMLHLNLAYPLDGDDTIDNVQFKLGTEATF